MVLHVDSDAPRKTDFEFSLQRHFDLNTAKAIKSALKKLQLPIPENRDEYIYGTDGVLIFSNQYGVVIRIEQEDGKAYKNSSSADNSPWMLQPLGTIKTGNARIEICPGVHFETSDAEARKLYWKMWKDGYNYWDERLDNAGRLPLKLPQFPQGVPIVIDRLAVSELTNAIAPIKRALALLVVPPAVGMIRSPVIRPTMNLMDAFSEQKQMLIEAWKKVTRAAPPDPIKNPQEILYGALKKSFREAWPEGAKKPSPEKMKKFWDMTVDAKSEGVLVAGWNETWDKKRYKGSTSKPRWAQRAADNYSQRLKNPEK